MVKALNEIVDRGAPVQANTTLKHIKQMFNWGMGQGLVNSNPVEKVKAKEIGGIEKPRDNYLELDEVFRLWGFLDNGRHRIHLQNVIALKLILLTGTRPIEVRTMEWCDVDLDKKIWIVPPEKYKTGIQHHVPLSDKVLELFVTLKALTGKYRWCIPSSEDKEKPVSDRALVKIASRLDSRIKGVHDWRPHDLRRTFRTLISQKGIADPVVGEKLLGHAMPKIMATYDKDQMLPQRREALEKWADMLPEV